MFCSLEPLPAGAELSSNIINSVDLRSSGKDGMAS